MKDKLAILFIIIVGLLFYSLTLRGVPGNPKADDFKNNLDQVTKPLELSPERGRFASVLALGDYHTYDLGKELADAVYPDAGVYNGKYFSLFAPGLAYMDLPFYLLGKHFQLSQVLSFAFISFVSVLVLAFLYKIAREIFKLPVWASLFAVLVFAFASTSWSYATTLYQHLVTLFFMLSGFYAAWKYSQRQRFTLLWAVWVWLSYGLAITVDYPNALMMLPIMVYFLAVSFQIIRTNQSIRLSLRPAIVATAVFFLAVLVLQGYHSQANFGSWKRLSNQLSNYRGDGQQATVAHSDSSQAINRISAQKGLTTFFYETNVPFGFYTLTVSPDRGLFFFSPIFLLAFLGMFKIRKEMNLEIKVLLALTAVNVLLYSSWGDPWGGWAFGPRYLIPSMAILALFVGVWVYRAHSFLWGKLMPAALFVYSSAVALLGALVTNAVPPKVEALNLPLHYSNYFYNIYLLKQNKSGSFLYNTYFLHRLTLKEYFLAIFTLLLLVMALLLFIIPFFKRHAANNP
jgi:hypothetical protein